METNWQSLSVGALTLILALGDYDHILTAQILDILNSIEKLRLVKTEPPAPPSA